MYGQTSYDASKNSMAPKGLTAVLLGLIICYQVANQIFLHKAIHNEDADFESDAACTAVPGASGYSCMEAKLFQGWHELPAESPAELENLLAVSPVNSPKEPSVTTSASPSAPATQAPAGAQGLRGDVKTEEQKDTSVTTQSSEVKPEEDAGKALEGMLWDLAWAMGGGDQSHSAPEKNKKKTQKKHSAFMAKPSKPEVKKTSFAQGLTDLQQKLEAKMQAQARRHAEHRKLRALHAARSHSHDATAEDDKMTPWAHDLDDLTHELQAQMQDWRKERSEHAATFAAKTNKTAPYDGMTPWAHNLDDLTHEMQDHMAARNKERAEHAAAHKAAHEARLAAAHKAAEEAAHQDTRTSFMDEIDALGRELCQDPERRNRPSCAQFMHPHTSSAPNEQSEKEKPRADSHDSAMAHIKLLEKHLHELEKDREHENEEILNESNQFLKELCADPARHDYPACARVLATTTVPTPRLRSSPATRAPVAAESSPKPAAHVHTLHWAPMKEADAKNSPHHADTSPLVMQRQELRGTHWEGKVPTVACVTVLPEGQVTETLMRYFMDNYNLLHYEGKRELVLVYSQNDAEANRIAHLYANGTAVKVAAARGGDGFPSATAFRYGAWLAHDADIVVRWDFEAWHHPNRLSMQVRAMAISNRPASLVTKVTAFDADGKSSTVPGGAGPHGSMMGDAVWMRKHWMPLLEEEATVLHGLHSSDVVQVAMPELLAYHDVSMLGVA